VVHREGFSAKSTDVAASHTAAASRFGTAATGITASEQQQEQRDEQTTSSVTSCTAALVLLPVVLLH